MQTTPAPSAPERLSRACNRITERALCVLGLGMTVIVIAQVFSRYLLNHSLFWSEELARYLLIWLTFLGAAAAYQRGMHPGIDLFYRRLPARLKRRVALATHGLALAFFFVMIWHGSRFAYFVRLQTTPALALPKWIVYAIIPVSGALLAIHGIAFVRREWRRRGDEP